MRPGVEAGVFGVLEGNPRFLVLSTFSTPTVPKLKSTT